MLRINTAALIVGGHSRATEFWRQAGSDTCYATANPGQTTVSSI
jgi:hypothetical protein